MNKKLMAVAVAGALAAPGLAVAQVGGSPGVTLYGRLDTAIMNNTYSAVGTTISELKKGDVFSPGNAMGVRGREDLGGGTAMWFQLETGVWPDGRLENAGSNGAHFGGRNSALGISSTWGDVMYGLWDAPYKVAYGTGNVISSGPFSASGIIMGNGDTTGALPNVRCAGALIGVTGSVNTTANNVCVSEVTANGTAWSRRNNNSVQYWSPVVSGLQFRLGTAVANYQSPGTSQSASGLPKPKYLSGSVTWARGPLALALGYETHEGLRPSTVAGGNANPKDTAFQLGVKWNFGPGQVGVGYETLDYGANNAAGTNGLKVPAMVVNGRFNLGPGALWAGLSKTDGGKDCTGTTTVGSASCGAAGEAKMTVVGYDYVMSKRTKMYFAYSKIDNGTNTNYYYIAGPAGNANNGTTGGIAASTDVTTLAFGMQHTF